MANSDKNIIITPNISSTTADPTIVFSGANSTLTAQTITAYAYPQANGTVSFQGSAGQLFSITNTLSGTIFSVNDVSGIPSITVEDTGLVNIAQYGGFITYGVNAALTATGTTQATALLLSRPINNVTTVAASTGVIFPIPTNGMRIIVRNGGANVLNIYPSSGAAINTLAANAAFSLAVASTLEFVAFSSTQWYTLNTTYA
jgi:hypothetical protein